MSNIEKIRKEAKIAGYVHPTENKPSNSTNSYKIFNTEKKDTDYSTSKSKSHYATFTDKDSISKVCPDCGGNALYICDCEFNDKQCSNGHVWYIDKFGSIKRNDPHEDE